MEKTYQPKHKDIKRDWHLIDAKDQVLGRLSTKIVGLLTGKTKVNYSAHMDMGDYVVVINAKHVKVTGQKEDQKVYQGHSGYPGGFKEVSLKKLREENPTRIIQLAVKRMMATNRLRDKRLARLKILAGEENRYMEKFKQA